MAADLERLVEEMAGGGWAQFDEARLAELQRRTDEAIQQQAREEAAIFAATFNTPAGKKCLALLLGKTLLRDASAADRDLPSAELFAIAKARREGQGQIVHMILAALALAAGQTATTEGLTE